MTLAQLLAAHPVVLLDFDGPICAVFGGELPAPDVARQLANVARQRGVQLPYDVNATGDPFDVLHAAAKNSSADAAVVEQALRDSEVRAVASAPMTPGLRDALDALRRTDHTITIVSNNSAEAVCAFLRARDLTASIDHVVARTEPDPALLKPNRHLVTQGIDTSGSTADQCVLIGDSITDIAAARAAGTAVIAYANRPGKRESLAAHSPGAVIDEMADIVRATEQTHVS